MSVEHNKQIKEILQLPKVIIRIIFEYAIEEYYMILTTLVQKSKKSQLLTQSYNDEKIMIYHGFKDEHSICQYLYSNITIFEKYVTEKQNLIRSDKNKEKYWSRLRGVLSRVLASKMGRLNFVFGEEIYDKKKQQFSYKYQIRLKLSSDCIGIDFENSTPLEYVFGTEVYL